ncbi:MAG TPA: ABC transporter permease subunit [Chloroflexota bacterium]|jgi:iron(III) transport system permease protein
MSLVPSVARQAALSPRWPSLSWAQVGVLALLGAVGFYVLYPLILILLNSFNVARIGQAPVYSLQPWIDAWSASDVFPSLWTTLQLAFWYQLISFPIGILIAWLLARTNVPWARGLELMFWLSFFVPMLSTTLGWMLLADPRTGVLNQLAINILGIKQGPFNVYSFWGIVWVQLMAHAVSSKVMLLTPAFRNMDAALEEAGRMSGANNWVTMLRVTLPVMTPALIIVAMLALVRIFESFEIELLLGVPAGIYVYSTKILNLLRQEPPLIGQASALGSVTLLLLLVAAPVQRWLTTRRDYATVSGRMRTSLIDLGRWRWPVFALVALLVAMLVLVPVLSIILASFMTRFGFFTLAQTWTLANWQRTLGDAIFVRSLTNTLVLALSAAIIGPLIFSVIAYVVVRAKRVWGRSLLDLLLWVPSVIPGALAGLGLLWMFVGTPIFHPVYGTIFVLIIAAVMGTVTLATQLFKATLLQLGPEMEEAARMSGANAIRTYFRIVLPLLAPTLVLVGTLKFLFAANATASIILLATSETRTLSLLTLDFVAEGLRESAAVTTVIITALTTGVALAARALGLNVGLRA